MSQSQTLKPLAERVREALVEFVKTRSVKSANYSELCKALRPAALADRWPEWTESGAPLIAEVANAAAPTLFTNWYNSKAEEVLLRQELISEISQNPLPPEPPLRSLSERVADVLAMMNRVGVENPDYITMSKALANAASADGWPEWTRFLVADIAKEASKQAAGPFVGWNGSDAEADRLADKLVPLWSQMAGAKRPEPAAVTVPGVTKVPESVTLKPDPDEERLARVKKTLEESLDGQTLLDHGRILRPAALALARAQFEQGWQDTEEQLLVALRGYLRGLGYSHAEYATSVTTRDWFQREHDLLRKATKEAGEAAVRAIAQAAATTLPARVKRILETLNLRETAYQLRICPHGGKVLARAMCSEHWKEDIGTVADAFLDYAEADGYLIAAGREGNRNAIVRAMSDEFNAITAEELATALQSASLAQHLRLVMEKVKADLAKAGLMTYAHASMVAAVAETAAGWAEWREDNVDELAVAISRAAVNAGINFWDGSPGETSVTAQVLRSHFRATKPAAVEPAKPSLKERVEKALVAWRTAKGDSSNGYQSAVGALKLAAEQDAWPEWVNGNANELAEVATEAASRLWIGWWNNETDRTRLRLEINKRLPAAPTPEPAPAPAEEIPSALVLGISDALKPHSVVSLTKSSQLEGVGLPLLAKAMAGGALAARPGEVMDAVFRMVKAADPNAGYLDIRDILVHRLTSQYDQALHQALRGTAPAVEPETVVQGRRVPKGVVELTRLSKQSPPVKCKFALLCPTICAVTEHDGNVYILTYPQETVHEAVRVTESYDEVLALWAAAQAELEG